SFTIAAINQHLDTQDFRLIGLQGRQGFAYREAGGQHIINNQHALSRMQHKAAPQFTSAAGYWFGDHAADAKLASNFLSQQSTTCRRTNHHRNIPLTIALRDQSAESLGHAWMFKDAKFLPVLVAMSPGTEQEM